MREIKFRAWDEDDKTMRSWTDVIINKEPSDNYWLLGYEENRVVTNFDHKQIMMQYTGLKDKNGVDIYEGDIIDDLNGEGNGVVEFLRGAFRVNYKNGYAKWFIDYMESEKPRIEVIGNIYENPELLDE